MTAAIRNRRAIRGRLRLAVPLLVMAALPGGPLPAVGAEPLESPNLLDRPMADLAVLDGPDPATTPLLLVLDAVSPNPAMARIAILRRIDAWVPAATIDIDLGADSLDARWLVDLGEERFALVATSPMSAPGTGRAVVVGFTVGRASDAVTIEEVNRQTFDRAIEDAGAADVDGFGSAELVLGLRTVFDPIGSCGTSTLVVADGQVSAIRRLIDVPGRLGAGVIGRFDEVAGEDLLLYGSADCPPGGAGESRLSAIRLADGTRSPAIGKVLQGDPTVLPPPIRVDLDGSAPDEAIAMAEAGLTVFDPSDAWRGMLVAGIGSVPLLGATTPPAETPSARVALLDASGRGSLVTARLRRGEAGELLWEGRSELQSSALDPNRWMILATSIQAAATEGLSSNAWLGDAVEPGCPDLVVPGAILPCGTDEIRSGAAWLATRPFAALPIGRQRVLLVAAGLGWEPDARPPPSPAPSAAGPAGWWRRGPSPPFAVSEIRSEDLVYFNNFPTPAATIESTTAKDGTTALPGFTGARLFTAIVPLAEGEDGPPAPIDALAALTSRPGQGGRTTVVRVPVPPGLESGRDGSFARLSIGDLALADGRPTGRWAMQVVPINDWGEWGQPVARIITRDAVGPTVAVEEPFTSPIWPFFTHLAGRSEPGSSVRVDGIGDLEVDRRGRFSIDAQLAPWPQVFRVTATDPAGNVTVGEFTIVGGVDYRRFPWPGIVAAAMLALVAARGLFGGGRSRAGGVEPTRWSTGSLDDASTPEIEELPPGSGVARG